MEFNHGHTAIAHTVHLGTHSHSESFGLPLHVICTSTGQG